MKNILPTPANFERHCFHVWELNGTWRDGSKKYKCKYCGKET